MSDESTWLYITTPLDSDSRKFKLAQIEGKEQISGLFHYHLTLRTEDKNVDFKKIMGKNAAVHLMFPDKSNTRYINGIVTRFVQGNFDGGVVTYFAELRPWLWQLTLSSNNKIFQNKSVTDIISAVFNDAGFTDFKLGTTGTYSPKEYCVQYGETDFNFVSRLMEEAGIFYYFEHTADKHTLVLADDAGASPACPGLTSVKLKGFSPIADHLAEDCILEQELLTNKYKTKDFNFETPDTDLLAKVDGKEQGTLTVYDYPGKYTTTGDGQTISDKRIAALESLGKILKGNSYVRGFIAGYKFTFGDHYRSDVNGDYVLRHLTVHATDQLYTNTFEAFPSSVVFRPPQTAKKSRIYGTQTAMVVGKKGEEIWPDKYGRVKVQFHWDLEGKKDETSSCWVRVAQVWAGKGWGTLFIPRIGTEVIVSFAEGDPDQPIIIGTVYNASRTVPYTLPDEKNKSTIKTMSVKEGQAGNEIRFDDTKDKEELHIHAQKNMTVKVENDHIIEILNNRTDNIAQNRSVTIKEGNETLIVDKGDRTVSINTGNETHTNKGNFNHSVKGNYALKVDGSLTIEVTGKVMIKGARIDLNP
jgi:type VI secretion system secreted protein VgrG